MLLFVKTNANNKILKQLINTNCLSFGRNPKLNNKKINHYIFGTRQKLDIFKFSELRYLLVKIYPLIHNLFLQARLNQIKKKKWFFNKNFDFQTKNLPKNFRKFKSFQNLKDKFNRTFKEKTTKQLIPKILFATTTDIYSEIVSSAAKKCHMPCHVNRWLHGAITAAAFYKNVDESWSFWTNSFEEKYMLSTAQNQFFKHKKNFNLQKTKFLKYQLIRKPTLIIIPDISNNEMILKETNSLGIPALGLVNSNCSLEIAYPIFANDLSLYSVHFFCNFLSSLILKEFVKYKHQIYNRRKNIRNLQFLQANKDILRFNKRIFFKKVYNKKVQIRKIFIKNYEKKIEKLNADKKKVKQKEIKYLKENIQRSYQNKVNALKKVVQNYFKTKAYKKSIRQVQKYSFKGKYFIEHFYKPRRKIKKNIINFTYANQKFKKDWKKKLIRNFVSPKKLILVENWKRLTKTKTNFYLKKRILQKMNLVQKLRFYNFSKIIKEIRLPNNKPKFRYWNKKKFWFSTPIKFASTWTGWYIFKRFKLKNLLREKTRNKRSQKKNVVWKKNNSLLRKKEYRKRWSTKKVIKGHIKQKIKF